MNKYTENFRISQVHLWKLRYLIGFGLLLSFILTGLIYKQFVTNQILYLNSLTADARLLKEQLIKEQQLFNLLPQYKNRLNSLAQTEMAVKTHLVLNARLTDVILEINQLAQDMKIQVISFESKESLTNQSTTFVKLGEMNNSNYHFNARGTYINFIGFFIKLMQLSKNFIPKNLIISRIDDEMVNIELDLQITYEND